MSNCCGSSHKKEVKNHNEETSTGAQKNILTWGIITLIVLGLLAWLI